MDAHVNMMANAVEGLVKTGHQVCAIVDYEGGNLSPITGLTDL